MNDNLNEISQDVLSTIRVTLITGIRTYWQHRRLFRREIRERVQALRVMHLPADGKHYVVDTTKPHTAVNASREKRVHIVGCI